MEYPRALEGDQLGHWKGAQPPHQAHSCRYTSWTGAASTALEMQSPLPCMEELEEESSSQGSWNLGYLNRSSKATDSTASAGGSFKLDPLPVGLIASSTGEAFSSSGPSKAGAYGSFPTPPAGSQRTHYPAPQGLAGLPDSHILASERHRNGAPSSNPSSFALRAGVSCRYTSWTEGESDMISFEGSHTALQSESGHQPMLSARGSSAARGSIMPGASEAGTLANPFSWKEFEHSCRELDAASFRISEVDLTCILDAGEEGDDHVLYNFKVEGPYQPLSTAPQIPSTDSDLITLPVHQEAAPSGIEKAPKGLRHVAASRSLYHSFRGPPVARGRLAEQAGRSLDGSSPELGPHAARLGNSGLRMVQSNADLVTKDRLSLDEAKMRRGEVWSLAGRGAMLGSPSHKEQVVERSKSLGKLFNSVTARCKSLMRGTSGKGLGAAC